MPDMRREASVQSLLFDEPPAMPPTRYQGSKRKIAPWIADQLADVPFDTVLDAFGGTGSVGYELKRRGKTVTYNDVLDFNHWIGCALIENNAAGLSESAQNRLVLPDPGRTYDDVVSRTFGGIYFTDAENRWIDVVVQNIQRLPSGPAKAVAYYALFQAALAKRPYNLFHRRNLYMRQADVARSFGNKTTWDRPFEDHLRRFVAQANRAAFDNGRPCRAISRDALDIDEPFELVYVDPPYINSRGVGVDYRRFYHFLEGLADYSNWAGRIDMASKHRCLSPTPAPWSSPAHLLQKLDGLFARFADSVLAVSYRSDGIPSIDEIERLLGRFKRHVRVARHRPYQYALSTNRNSREVLLIGT